MGCRAGHSLRTHTGWALTQRGALGTGSRQLCPQEGPVLGGSEGLRGWSPCPLLRTQWESPGVALRLPSVATLGPPSHVDSRTPQFEKPTAPLPGPLRDGPPEANLGPQAPTALSIPLSGSRGHRGIPPPFPPLPLPALPSPLPHLLNVAVTLPPPAPRSLPAAPTCLRAPRPSDSMPMSSPGSAPHTHHTCTYTQAHTTYTCMYTTSITDTPHTQNTRLMLAPTHAHASDGSPTARAHP